MSQTVYKISRDCQDDDCYEAAERGGEEEGGRGERDASCPGFQKSSYLSICNKVILVIIIIIGGEGGASCSGFQKSSSCCCQSHHHQIVHR